MRTRLCFLLLCLSTSASHAIEPYGCRNGFFPAAAGSVREAVVRGGPDGRSFFRGDAQGCPMNDACIGEAIPRGAHVLVSTQDDGWSCAWRSGRDDETVGWLPTAELAVVARRKVLVRDWIGRWEPIVGGGDRIDIAPRGGTGLRSRGQANWVGGIDGYGERVVHLGGFAGESAPVDDLLTVTDGACIVRMQWVARSLVVAGNAACGGMNVRFDGVYRMRRR